VRRVNKLKVERPSRSVDGQSAAWMNSTPTDRWHHWHRFRWRTATDDVLISRNDHASHSYSRTPSQPLHLRALTIAISIHTVTRP